MSLIKELEDRTLLSGLNYNYIRNGRVDIEGRSIDARYDLYREHGNGNRVFREEAVKTILTGNKLQSAFFSAKNINILQELLQYHVAKQSFGKYKIGRQSDINLQIIMRSIYLQYGRNLETDIVGQVRELNSKVIEYAVPNILSRISQYLQYKRDVSMMPIPLERPKYLSPSGTRTHPDYLL